MVSDTKSVRALSKNTMNQRLSSFQVGPLPTLFYRDDGDLDVDLFGELWASAGLQNKQLKSLIRPEIFSSSDDAGRIRALAQLCERGDWRKGWYQDASARKKGVPPSIQNLAQRYAKQTLPALDMSEDGLGKFFKKAANGKIYPRLEKTGELADFLGQCPERTCAAIDRKKSSDGLGAKE